MGTVIAGDSHTAHSCKRHSVSHRETHRYPQGLLYSEVRLKAPTDDRVPPTGNKISQINTNVGKFH